MPAQDQNPSPVITAEQIEADWLRQAVVRSKPLAGPQIGSRQDAAGGCDGVIDGHFGFHTQQEENPWWQVDLGQTLPLDRIVIYNRGDGVAQCAARLKILLSENNRDWRPLYEHDGSEFLGFADQKPLQVVAGDGVARYVRVQLPGTNYLHLDEVEVYRDGSPENVALRQPADQSSVSPWSTWNPLDLPEPPGTVVYPVAEVIDRGLRLAGDLSAQGVDVQAAITSLCAISAQCAALSDNSPAEQRRALLLQAHRVIRRLALGNPLLISTTWCSSSACPGTFTHMSDQILRLVLAARRRAVRARRIQDGPPRSCGV